MGELTKTSRWWISVAAIVIVTFAIASSLQRDSAVTPREAARKLQGASLRDGSHLSGIECARYLDLPRNFLCFGEGPNDIHLGLMVGIGRDGRLNVSALH